jgi:hypothetical protein
MHIEHRLIRDDNYLCAICEIVNSLHMRMRENYNLLM